MNSAENSSRSMRAPPIAWLSSAPKRNPCSSATPSGIPSRTCRSGLTKSTRMAATKTTKSAAPAPSGAASSPAPVALICGDDDFAVKQRARALFQQWSEELGGMDHETIDARINNVDEALKAIARLREGLNTLPFFGGAKV